MHEPRVNQFSVTDHVAVDFESYFSKAEKITIKDLGAWKYLQTAEIYLVGIYAGGDDWFVGHPKDFDWRSIAGRHWVSHNRSFDKEAWKRLVELGTCAEADAPSKWDCTADLSTWCRCMRNLKDAAHYLLGKVASKNVRTLMNGLTPAQMRESVMAENGKLYPITSFDELWQPTVYEIAEDGFDHTFYGDVCRYCLNDAIICWELWAVHSPRWPERERRISRLTGEQGSTGIQMDADGITRDLEILNLACAYAKAQMPWAKDLPSDEGVMSVPALKKAIQALGITPPTTTSEDSEACRAWEAKHPDVLYVKFLRDFRKCNILRRRHEHVMARLKPNGRYPFAWLYGGAPHTMRWAGGSDYKRGGTGDTGWNVQNQAKGSTFIMPWGEVVTEQSPAAFMVKAYEVNPRSRCIVAEGKKWICADAEQIEARVTLWVAGEVEGLALVAKGMSIYEVHARKAMGWKGGNIKEEDPDQQFMAKNRVLALGFGCGKVKFHDRCRELGFPITMDEASRQVKSFRTKELKIKRTWYRLGNEIEGCARRNDFRRERNARRLAGLLEGELEALEDYELELPNGESIMYLEPWMVKATKDKPIVKELPPAKTEAEALTRYGREIAKDRRFGQNVCAKVVRGGRTTFLYGGKVLENLVQRIARDILCHMMLNLDDAGIPMIFSVHDEEDLEVDASVTCAEVKATMEQMPEWCDGLPVSVEVKEAGYYFK